MYALRSVTYSPTGSELAMRSDSIYEQHDFLLSRIRGEYSEMPGLKLTVPQACRLWQLDRDTCESVLDQLAAEHFLLRTAEGSYIAFPPTRPSAAKATLPLSYRRMRA